jgi:hypothetical protein
LASLVGATGVERRGLVSLVNVGDELAVEKSSRKGLVGDFKEGTVAEGRRWGGGWLKNRWLL